MFEELDKKVGYIKSKRPLPIEVVQNLKKYFDVEWTYNSNAIEGNTLTLSETKLVIEDGLTIGGKTMNEHLEAINHKQAIDFVEDIAKNNIEITEDVILKIHGLILKNIDNRNAGNYRFVNVRISGSSHLPPNHIKLNTLMSEFVDWYTSNKDTMHPVQLAAELHHKLVYIHPFVDGNGRTARLLMNLVLLKHGYPLAIISVKNRADYIKALEKASIEHDLTDFITIVANASEETADKIIELID